MNYQPILDEIHQEVLALLPCGTMATYIPQLASVSPQKFGMAVQTVDGQSYHVGQALEAFSIQSISKVYTLTLAFTFEGDKIWTRVGLEPSGSTFNSLVQLEYEHGIPRNPFINAGALVVIDILLDHLKDPNDEILAFVNKLRCSNLHYNEEVVSSGGPGGGQGASLLRGRDGEKGRARNKKRPEASCLDAPDLERLHALLESRCRFSCGTG